MDSTAPNNPNNPAQGAPPQNPIQPGQFVVAGDNSAAPPPQTPVAGMSLAQENVPDPAPGPMPGAPPVPASVPGAQPDPTPFSPPGQPFPGQAAPQAPSSGGGSQMKMILIIVAVLVLVGIIAAVVVMFVLPNLNSSETPVTTTEVEEPLVPVQRTDGGFGQIPATTESAAPTEDIPPAGNDTTAPGGIPATGL